MPRSPMLAPRWSGSEEDPSCSSVIDPQIWLADHGRNQQKPRSGQVRIRRSGQMIQTPKAGIAARKPALGDGRIRPSGVPAGRRMTALSCSEVLISAERSPDASTAAASGRSSRPAQRNRRAATGHARPHQPGPPRPASASTSSHRPTPHGWCPPLPDQVPEGRDRGPATVAPSERGATPRRQCPERSGTAVGTSRPPARHWRRQIAQQLPPAPPGRPLDGEPPQRPAPATRHRGVQPSAEPARGRHRAGDDCTREPQARGRRQRRGTSPRPARSQPARRWSPDRQYSRDQPGGRAADAGVSVVPLRAHRVQLRLHERRRRTAGHAR